MFKAKTMLYMMWPSMISPKLFFYFYMEMFSGGESISKVTASVAKSGSQTSRNTRKAENFHGNKN